MTSHDFRPSADRSDRALLAYVQQELSAPAEAIAGYAEILLDEAERNGHGEFRDDLEKIHAASRSLIDVIASLVGRSREATRGPSEDSEDYRRHLRHDLRTPINAIKGYGEMLREDAAGIDDAQALVLDLNRLLEEASRLLERIDGLVSFSLPETEAATDADIGSGPVSAMVAHRFVASVQPISETEADSVAVQPSRILVVDDNASNRELLKRRLERQGHSVGLAENGSCSLEMLREAPFDLILLDLLMPDISGFDVLSILKADPALRDIPVIVISALNEIDSIVRCIEAGADDYLAKPFDPVLLRARIGSSLEKKHLRDREREALDALRIEKERSEQLLLNILPAPIIARLKSGETVIADHVSDVTILFADFVGFTELSSKLPAPELVGVLGSVFSAFDGLALKFGVEKIKTIGDAYMVACGLFGDRDDHAHAVADMALAMAETLDILNDTLPTPLEIRMGINSGDVVAGVIGAHKFIYDIWGDAVNIASRLESSSLPGRIQVSASTYEHLCRDFVLAPRDGLEIKGKGAMEAFFLTGRR
ncbi:adenylate/guanylate cyclase domain-containing protein [Methylocystis sp. SB2]|uniref:adenylate/guanylate cyclase domain-containing protein n=1 Tax=Methylocystis sp. (strain SB2) TaxID=743836 RepID=UPI000688BA62|nr:adenylate/guanylate cyclase domain-containing protein [Methylocystis sp. SB2]ULO23077.1 response regulator [Methylocystis sp. SB2]